ncbi:hypothetical protein RND81_03G081900 [Saponaria officinalis]|uniref:Uncharacterized protein n=1 Tax=Saponaria officinalis TaxID=3572 RepID=A0AAW1M6T0_SAPOF
MCSIGRPLSYLNIEEWRVHRLPIGFMFTTVFPVIDMRLRCKTSGKEYPPGISPAISKVLELDIVRWELQGLMMRQSQLSLVLELKEPFTQTDMG